MTVYQVSQLKGEKAFTGCLFQITIGNIKPFVTELVANQEQLLNDVEVRKI